MAKEISDEKRILFGDFNFSLPSQMNYGKVFLEKILEFKNKVALIDGVTDEQITFKEMAQKIVNVAFSLTQLGVKKGDVVAICSENRIELLTTAVAVMYSGAVLTFLNSSYVKDEIIFIANISKPKYVFVSPNAYDAHYKTLKDLNTIKQFFIFGGNINGRADVITFEELAEKSEDTKFFEGANFYGRAHKAIILYSSGTTGLPKGLAVTHLSCITTTYHVPITHRPLTILTVSPFTNTLGLFTATDALTSGKTIAFLSKFKEITFLSTIEKYKVGMIFAAPPTVVTLCKSSIVDKYDVSSVELIQCGGAPLEADIITEAYSRLPNLKCVLQGYGMTEACGCISRETESAYKLGSVGKVVAGNIVKVVDIETRKILGPGHTGELCLNGSAIFDGYIGKPVEECFEDGWLKTGDIGYYDEEGYIFIVDRLKELIKYKAWQVAPSELEAILLKHPSVRDAAVVGKSDKIAGELPTAFIVKKPGHDTSEQDIMVYLAAKVSPWKKLRGGVRFVEEIPKNPSGKILRRLLRELLIKPASKL